jgi:predicted RNA binding protein YcfA (HicA-like mRNA interferase family)
MKPMNAAQIMKYLQEHGFIKSHGVGSHRGMFNPQTGKRTVIPFHGKNHCRKERYWRYADKQECQSPSGKTIQY